MRQEEESVSNTSPCHHCGRGKKGQAVMKTDEHESDHDGSDHYHVVQEYLEERLMNGIIAHQ